MLLRPEGGRPLVVKPTQLRVIGAACAALFLTLSVWSWLDAAGWPTYVFLVLSALSLYLLLSGSVEMDDGQVTYRTPLGTYRIRWDEVTLVETDRTGGNIVFRGEGKRLNVVGPYYWSGADKAEMVRLFVGQVERRGIPVRVTAAAQFRLSKGTRVGR